MEAKDFRRIEALFNAALERPAAERVAFVNASAEEPAVREAALRLLGRAFEGDTTLHTAALSAAAAAATPMLRHVGPYEILGELGAGGMGTVLLAERAFGETRQKVALKLIRGFPTAQAREQLARERSLLAGLNHPNIAGLLDAGETEDHVPYLAMEYVEGVPLHRFCSEHALDRRQRLRLFAQLCRAVQHAHQRLVVHRDIKPSNVLVREDGTPVLLDFGIGKLLDASAREATSTRAFTPAYAAPEQLAGRTVTTATDVYGLGCVLHELLSGRALHEISADGRVPLPSAAALDTTQARSLRGDLDTLVGKALHAEPERRYASAQALADDVENFLAGRPLVAAPDSLAYRARKFVARHRLAAAASIIGAALALLFVWRLGAERDRALVAETRAERAAQSARRSRDFLVSLFEAAAPGNALGRPLTARELIDKGAQGLGRELKDEPDAAARLGQTIASVYGALGDPKAAIENGERALALAAGDGADAALLRADILLTLVNEYDNTERFDDARKAGEQALALRQRHAPDDRAALAATYAELGNAANRRGDNAQARGYFDHALAAFERLPQVEPKDRSAVWSGIAEVDVQEGKLDEAVRHGELSVRALDALPAASPERLDAWRMLARAQIAHGEGASGVATLEKALDVAHAALGEDSYKTADVENDLAVALNSVGRYREAIGHLEKSIAIVDKLRPDQGAANAYTILNLGSLYESLGDYARSESLMREGIGQMEKFTPDEAMLDYFRGNLARTLMLRGDAAAARALQERAMQGIAARDGKDSYNYGFQVFRLARIEMIAGNADGAELNLLEAMKTLDPKLPPKHALRVQADVLRGVIARTRGDFAGAREHFEAAERMQSSIVAGDPILLASIRMRDAGALLGSGDLAAAHRQLDAALPVLDKALLPQAVELIEAHGYRDELARREAGSRSGSP